VIIRRSVREWEYLPVSADGSETGLSRAEADQLLLVAQAAQSTLNLGGEDVESILVNGVSRIRAQQVVGILVAPGVALEILPKIDGLETDDRQTRVNLVRMLARTHNLSIAEGALTSLGRQEHDLLEILIRIFATKLFVAVHRGLPRRYIGLEDDLGTLRGGLDVKRQFTILAATPQKLACRFEELSSDIPLNQLMKAAVLQLRAVSGSPENQRRLRELALAFADVRSVPLSQVVVQNVVLDRTNTDWHELVRLAKLLLGRQFQTTSAGRIEGFSLLFEMNTLFEEFIGRTLQRRLAGTDLEVSLQGPRSHVLSEKDGGAFRFRTIPDIVIHRGGNPFLIIDTKWKRLKGELDDRKRGVGQSDVYQMLAYGDVYNVARLMLLYPHHDALGSHAGTLGEYRVIGNEARTLAVASVSLLDLEVVADRLATLVAGALERSERSAAA